MGLDEWWSVALERAGDECRSTGRLASALDETLSAGKRLHLAVLVEPFLSYVLQGSKTIESRFSACSAAPYRAVLVGEVILLKRAGGAVEGAGVAAAVTYYKHPTAEDVEGIREQFGESLRDDVPGFWEKRSSASYITLIELRGVESFARPFSCPKQDRRGWAVLRARDEQLSLFS